MSIKKEKNTRYDMGAGFSLEIIKTIPDIDGNDLEGFLYMKSELLHLAHNRLFTENTDVISYFKDVIIPEIALSHNIKEIKYLKGDAIIAALVKEYLLRKNITYGTTIDVIQLLVDEGYAAPDENDASQIYEIMAYFNCVNLIGKEICKQLTMFGFPADQNTNNTTDHMNWKRHPLCRNLVYSRYPWIVGYKAIKTVRDFLKITENDFLDGVDVVAYKKLEKTGYKTLKAVTDTLNIVSAGTAKVVEKTAFMIGLVKERILNRVALKDN